MQNWQSLLQRASWLRQAGRIGEAIDAYSQVLAVNSALPDAWYNLGWLQKQARAFDEALGSYARALALGISDPEEVHLNRAVIFSDHLHRPEEARRELEAAIQNNPRYLPALLNLGNLMEDLGDRAAARDAYERALETEPEDPLALARLGGLSHSPELDTNLAERLDSAIQRPATPLAGKADIGFALAGMLDAAGRYDEAFETARRANEASQESTGSRYDRLAVEAYVDRSIATFRKAPPRSYVNRQPIFICGMFRSGSTLVEQILASHSRVAARGELDLVPALVNRISGYPETVTSAQESEVGTWREFYLDGLPPPANGSKLVTDKRPDNFLHVGLVKTIFPNAKIIHTSRNPLDNLVSLYFLHLGPGMSYAMNFEDAAHWYSQYERLMAHWKRLYGGDIHGVDYDRLVGDPEPEIRSLLEFLGLQWEKGLLDFHKGKGAVKTASVWQVRQPLHSRSSGRWRNYEGKLMRFPALRRLAPGRD